MNMKKILKDERLLEAIALNATVQQMTEEENPSAITYSNDGPLDLSAPNQQCSYLQKLGKVSNIWR